MAIGTYILMLALIKKNRLSMKTFFRLIFVFTVLFSAQLKSQIISGKITSATNTSETIEFVNIGIKSKSFGTVSDSRGNFMIDITDKPDTDTIIFSHISYYPFISTLKDIRNNSVKNQFNLRLKERLTSLNEVVVQKRKTKIKWLGDVPSNAFQGNFLEDKLGCEFGTVFKFEGKKGRLKKVSMKIANSTYDSLYFRINVYNIKNGIPDTNILKQPIYYKGQGRYPKGYVLTVNLEEYDVFVDHDFVVSFEWIKNMGKGGLNFPFSLFRKNTVSRSTSQDNWNTKIYGTGIKTEVEIEK